MKILLINNQPVLDVVDGMGLNRDRQPDNGWPELRSTKIEGHHNVKEIDLSINMNKHWKWVLLEDLAYTYGNDTNKFRQKLVEFELI